jgi:hypothetical protein
MSFIRVSSKAILCDERLFFINEINDVLHPNGIVIILSDNMRVIKEETTVRNS